MRNDNAPNVNTNQGRRGRSNRKSKEKVNSTDVVVPILQFGSGNNFNVFKEKLAIVALEKFGLHTWAQRQKDFESHIQLVMQRMEQSLQFE